MTLVPRIAINGFGRIGRIVTRILLAGPPVDIVGINDPTDTTTMLHLFKHDSVHGAFSGTVTRDGEDVALNGDDFEFFHERDPSGLWHDLEPDLVIEASGHFRSKEKLQSHLDAGANRVLLTAPGDADITVVRGVNDDQITDAHRTVSNASCTTNCLALTLKVLDDAFGVDEALMTTIHSATNDQRVVDAPHDDLRRARGSLMSMIPTATGAAKAIGEVLPHLAGKIDGQAVRVPTADVSLVDAVVKTRDHPGLDAVREAYRAAASGPLQGLLDVTDEELVSVDFLGNPHSAVIDLPALQSSASLLKVMSWYDNEWGYASRVAELAHQLSR